MELGEQRRICVTASFGNVRRLAKFCRKCCGGAFTANERLLIELAVVEAANNIVSHAYGGSPGRPVELSVKRLSGAFEFSLADTGAPFDPGSAADPRFDWDGIQDVPEEGRGLFIIRSVMDSLEFSRDGEFNLTNMRKKCAAKKTRSREAEPPPFIQEQTMRAKLAQKEMEIAVSVHKRLTPEAPPEIPGLSVFMRSESAMQVGGDYVGCRKTASGGLWFMVCDAMGKGMYASFFSLLFHMAFHSILYMRGSLSPGGLLTLVNKIMAEDFNRFGMFMTSCVGMIDPGADKLYYASAGHCPPVLCSGPGTAELLDTCDYMLGVDDLTEYKTFSQPFTQGMRLLVYTDGVTDIIGANGEPVGTEPLLYACASELSSKEVREACGRIFSEVLIASGPSPQDDISMIGIERL
jgi:anti-sigma regulatory factor (Ser/Thr protein kinase)